MRFAKSVGYANFGTFEFLLDATGQAGVQPFVFIETNARLQVEHTVTEEVTGVDLVQAQILLAQGSTLNELGLDREPTLRGFAIEARNAVTGGGIDDVIDPADTRRWIVNSLKRLPPVLPRTEKKYPYIDPW